MNIGTTGCSPPLLPSISFGGSWTVKESPALFWSRLLPHGTWKQEGRLMWCWSFSPSSVQAQHRADSQHICTGKKVPAGVVVWWLGVCLSMYCLLLPQTVKPDCRGGIEGVPNKKLWALWQHPHRMNTGLKVNHALRVQEQQKALEPWLYLSTLSPHLHQRKALQRGGNRFNVGMSLLSPMSQVSAAFLDPESPGYLVRVLSLRQVLSQPWHPLKPRPGLSSELDSHFSAWLLIPPV